MKFALLGLPVEYSLSPQIHKAFAAQFGFELEYHLIAVPPQELKATLIELQYQQFRGVNITQPYKQTITAYATELSSQVKQVNAANVLTFEANGKIYANTTDGIGFLKAIRHHVPYSMKNQTVLLIGAGGAALSILPFLYQLQPTQVLLLNRTIASSHSLRNIYPNLQLFDGCQSYQWIVNATSIPYYELLSLFPLLSFHKKLIYDLTYQHEIDKSTHAIRHYQPLAVFTGLSMLVEQAAAAFWLWHHVHPDTEPVLNRIALLTH